MDANAKALRLALAVLRRGPGALRSVAKAEVAASRSALASMRRTTLATRAKFARGTSPHTLQHNRLQALRHAERRLGPGRIRRAT